MAEYTITLTDAEIRAMNHICLEPDDWIQNVFRHRIDTAMMALSDLEIKKSIHFGTEIITDREQLVKNSDEPMASDRISAAEYFINPDDPFVVPVVRVS